MPRYLCKSFSPVVCSVSAKDFEEAAKLLSQQISDRYSRDHDTTIKEILIENGRGSYLIEIYTPDGVREYQKHLWISLEHIQPIGAQLKTALDFNGLNIPGAAKRVGTQRGEEITTVQDRIRGYIADKPPKALRQFEDACQSLGYALTLTKI